MKLALKYNEMDTQIVETKVNPNGSFDVLHNGELVSIRHAGESQIDAIRALADALIYGDLLSSH